MVVSCIRAAVCTVMMSSSVHGMIHIFYIVQLEDREASRISLVFDGNISYLVILLVIGFFPAKYLFVIILMQLHPDNLFLTFFL